MAEAARKLEETCRVRVLEMGCGIGTMVERLIDGGLLTNTDYTGLDVDPRLVSEAGVRLEKCGKARFVSTPEPHGETTSLYSSAKNLRVRFITSDIFDFVSRGSAGARYDILLGHAFLDLVDPVSSMPAFLSLLKPGGLVYFTLNFDGVTIFEPLIARELDTLIVRLYHETMDKRRVNERPSGNSVAGRLLPHVLKNCGVDILAAGGSDWVLIPGVKRYGDDEVCFLHFIINTIYSALYGHPGIDGNDLSRWVGTRHMQIERGELIYIAHQIDILGRLAEAS